MVTLVGVFDCWLVLGWLVTFVDLLGFVALDFGVLGLPVGFDLLWGWYNTYFVALRWFSGFCEVCCLRRVLGGLIVFGCLFVGCVFWVCRVWILVSLGA